MSLVTLIVQESTWYPDQRAILRQYNIPFLLSCSVNLQLTVGDDLYVFADNQWFMNGMPMIEEPIKQLLTDSPKLTVRHIRSDGTVQEQKVTGVGADRKFISVTD